MSPPQHASRRASARALMAAGLGLLGACSAPTTRPLAGDAVAAIAHPSHEDVLWLERTGFGLDSQTLATYARLGRKAYLEQQLKPGDTALPEAVRTELATPPEPLSALRAVQAQRKQINALPEAERKAAREALNADGNQVAYEAARRELLQALYSPARLQEAMTWFWLNHFSVYEYKADLRWLVGDYVDHAIRPHALGHFRDLVLATLEHPAMLQYLDNDHNAAGRINENYARELMELHTLGVNGGYTQQDVQQLARVLTGVGVNAGDSPRVAQQWRSLYRRDGAFEFNPARHDFGAKTLLGRPLDGHGFDEVSNAVTLIVRQPACARFIARQIALYFMADDPPETLVARLAATFERSDGDIADVLRTLLLSHEFAASLGNKFKDPTRYVLSAVQLSYEQQPIGNVRPLLTWLRSLGEAPFERQTPDGYPLTQTGWASPGQLSRRFEIARAIGGGNAHLLDAEAPAPAQAPPTAAAQTINAGGFAQPINRIYYAAYEPFLAASTRRALAAAGSAQEWNTFLLASPDLNYE